ncbi:hypothetical protein [Pseudoxanthomonas suwonensis]|uniref:hypothetical protein n=1 Tax=Pseudoxanthomonas suwonensis TaxID=314722 RepID=UPI0012DE6AE1|nr:hypothetical protein [Pseudoxanthomonas suwonensis]
MSYTSQEAFYFYWHCTTAALLIEKLEHNTATNSHIRHAIRMASETARGKLGVQYASRDALARKPVDSSRWSGLDLVREHVVPVSVISKRVMDAHGDRLTYTWRELLGHLTQEDMNNWQILDSDYFLDRSADFSAVVAAIVRQWTVLAWVTKEEDKRLRKAGLTKSMPIGSEGKEQLSRYKACGIELVSI